MKGINEMIMLFLLVSIIIGLPIYYTIQDNRYYRGRHNRALRQINKSRDSVILTGTTTEHWVNMCKEIKEES